MMMAAAMVACRRPHFWILVAAYGVATGVNSCWITVLDVILKPFGITEVSNGILYVVMATRLVITVFQYPEAVTILYTDSFLKHAS